MDFSCPSFIANSSEESDGGYSSHDTSQEESIISFCYRNYLGYAYPIIVTKGNAVLLSQHLALPSYDGMRKDFVLSSLASPVKATVLLSNFLIVVLTEDGIFGVDLTLPLSYQEAKLLLGGTYSGLTVWGQETDCPLIVTSQTANGNASLLVIDISGETHVQEIPISSIPSDVLPFSNVASISVDDEMSIAYLVDSGLQKVIRMNLQNYDCSTYCMFPQETRVLCCLAIQGKVLVATSATSEGLELHAFHFSEHKKLMLAGKEISQLGYLGRGLGMILDGTVVLIEGSSLGLDI